MRYWKLLIFLQDSLKNIIFLEKKISKFVNSYLIVQKWITIFLGLKNILSIICIYHYVWALHHWKHIQGKINICHPAHLMGVILPIYHGSIQRQYDGTLGLVLHLFTKSTPQLSFTLSTHSLGKQVYNVFNIRTYSYTQNSTLLFQMVKKNQKLGFGLLVWKIYDFDNPNIPNMRSNY